MPKQRDRVRMSADEVAAMLAAGRKVQLATLNPDGYPHLVTMYYTLVAGKIAFWTYRTSQKALNLARDPRISCLVETGDGYFDLRGVQIQGVVQTIEDPAAVFEIGLSIGNVMGNPAAGEDAAGEAATGPGAGGSGPADTGPSETGPSETGAEEAIRAYVAEAARKRLAYIVEPRRVMSWDHAKLIGR
jgi:hypothetical protein